MLKIAKFSPVSNTVTFISLDTERFIRVIEYCETTIIEKNIGRINPKNDKPKNKRIIKPKKLIVKIGKNC